MTKEGHIILVHAMAAHPEVVRHEKETVSNGALYAITTPYVGIDLTDELYERVVEETDEAAFSGKGTWHCPQRGCPGMSAPRPLSPDAPPRLRSLWTAAEGLG